MYGVYMNRIIDVVTCMYTLVSLSLVLELSFEMARGQQKIQSQQKNAEKAAKLKKGQSHDQKKAAQAALTYKCTVCMVNIFSIPV